ncbi:hypothetical protein [Sphingomonas sp. Leaf62]|uniref:hypothetical protein n=1 Tax=Sphingomonas sp. Leaf62 TaxID=1736228 RepID=UPI003FA6A030
MRTMIRLIVPGAPEVSSASASGAASTVADAGIAASSAPAVAGATAILDAASAWGVIVTTFDGFASSTLSVATGAGTGGCVRRAAPKPSAAATTTPIATPVNRRFFSVIGPFLQ